MQPTFVSTNAPDPEIYELLAAAIEATETELSVEEIRRFFDVFLPDLYSRGPLDEVAWADSTVATQRTDVPIRTYEPTGQSADALDVIVYFHGGGWIAGDLATADPVARALAARLGVRVVSVDYRLAPENPFPAAFDDCLGVAAWIAARQSTRRLIVAGDSAGGNLAAAVALECACDGGIELSGQILIYPLLDHTASSDSCERFATGYGLTTKDVCRYIALYAGDGDPSDQRISPLNAESLRGVAPAIITTAGFDPLLDDGARYAERLIADDVQVSYLPGPTLLHGWLTLVVASNVANRELERLIAAVRGLLV